MNPRLEKRNKELYAERLKEGTSFAELGKKHGITKKRAWEIFKGEEKRAWEVFKDDERRRLGLEGQGS